MNTGNIHDTSNGYAPPSVASSPSTTRGANLPYITYEAEAGAYSGTLQSWNPSINEGPGDPGGEASGRQAVRLASQGSYVEWTASAKANALTMRYSIPDHPNGSGLDFSISIYRNGTKIDTFNLTSRYAWLYGSESLPTDSPSSGPPRKIYDESHLLLSQTINASDKIRIQKDSGDKSPYYDIDFVELEFVRPIQQRAGSYSVTAEGADPTGMSDSTAAFISARDKAGLGGTVWIPPGFYRMTAKIDAKGRNFHGAGPWYSTMWGANSWPIKSVDKTGFFVTGSNSVFKDFSIWGESHHRDSGDSAFVANFGDNAALYNIWIEHVDLGIYVGWSNDPPLPTNIRIDSCRVRNITADGIHLKYGTQNSIILNSNVRNAGDDSIVIWSGAGDARPVKNNLITNNTVQNVWRASGIALAGGEGNTVEYCVVKDTLVYPGVNIETAFNPTPFAGITTVRHLDLIRCGGKYWGHTPYPAIWVMSEYHGYDAPINFSDVSIVNASFQAIQFSAVRKPGVSPAEYGVFTPGSVRFDNVAITNAGTNGIVVDSTVAGGATFNNVSISSSGDKLVNNAGTKFVLTKTGTNDW